MKYQGEPDYRHDDVPRTGVLLVNLGTPDAPDTGSVRRYLREFLSDPRVIEAPRLLWWFVLRVILLIRPQRSAAAYRKIWRDDGSPLLTISREQTDALRSELGAQCKGPIAVQLAMRYGKPSIAAAMEAFRANGVRRLLVLPMYPQYCAATTASTFDALADELKRTRWLPELRFITHYHDEPGYIQALANSVKEHWQDNGRGEKLLLSFHGIPQRYLAAGDPYHCECHKTARLLAGKLGLAANEYQVSFQSRVGREPWLQPYTDETLTQLATQGVKTVDVICPGFSADCLETLEEIEMQNAERFVAAGGVRLAYIPALNAREDHIRFLADLCKRHLQGWPESSEQWSKHKTLEQAERAVALARRLGAQQ